MARVDARIVLFDPRLHGIEYRLVVRARLLDGAANFSEARFGDEEPWMFLRPGQLGATHGKGYHRAEAQVATRHFLAQFEVSSAARVSGRQGWHALPVPRTETKRLNELLR